MYDLGPDPQRALHDMVKNDPLPSEQNDVEYLCSRPLDIPPPQLLEDLNVKPVDLSSGKHQKGPG